MTKIKRTLPSHILLNIYNALLLSNLNYGLMLRGWKSNKLFRLQKRAARIVSMSKYNAHTSILFKRLNLLKITDLCALHDNMLPVNFTSDKINRLNTYRNHLQDTGSFTSTH